MASVINTNINSLTAQRHLNTSQGSLATAIERLSSAATAAVRGPALRQRLENMGIEPTGLGPAELATILRADYDKWGPVIRASGFKPAE